jgi:hypothetical protein
MILGLFLAAPQALAVWAGHAVVAPDLPADTHPWAVDVVEQYQVSVEPVSKTKNSNLRVEIAVPKEHAQDKGKKFYLVTAPEPLSRAELDLRSEVANFVMRNKQFQEMEEFAKKEEAALREELSKEHPPEQVDKIVKSLRDQPQNNPVRDFVTKNMEEWKKTRKIEDLQPAEVQEDGKIVLELDPDKATRSYIIWDFAAIVEEGAIVMDGGLYLTIDIPAYAPRLPGTEEKKAETERKNKNKK